MASATWHLEDAGLGELESTAQELLAAGIPFSNSLLREVQSKFAQQVTSMGYATFHEGLLVIRVDTVTSAARQQVHLNVWGQGRVTDGALDGQSDSTLVSAHHPLAYQGDISFHGVKGPGAANHGGLSADVWEHVWLGSLAPFMVGQNWLRRFSACNA